jgi:DNA ligase N terminus.
MRSIIIKYTILLKTYMLFAELCATFQKLEKINSILTMRDILSKFFKKTPSDEISIVCHLMEGQLATPYEGIVLGMADKMALKAISSAYGLNEEIVKKHTKRWVTQD